MKFSLVKWHETRNDNKDLPGYLAILDSFSVSNYDFSSRRPL